MYLAAASGSIWSWHLHPDIWLAIGGLAIGYTLALRRLVPASKPPNEPAATGRQKAFFYGGLLLLWLAADWPLHDLAERSSFSAHMVQHLLLSFVVPPMLLLGIPKWLYRRMLAPRWIFSLVRFLTKPVVALLIFNGVVAITHWPALVDLSVRSDLAHLSLHWILIGSSLIMWMPVVGRLPELPRLSEPAAMFYLFLQSVLPTVPASFLTFADAPVYHAYEGLPHLFGWSTLEDQRIAGLIMKLGGGLLLWSIITYVFFRWNARETSGHVDEVSWEDFERELQVWDLRR